MRSKVEAQRDWKFFGCSFARLDGCPLELLTLTEHVIQWILQVTMLCPAFERIGQGLSQATQAEQSTATICIVSHEANQKMISCTVTAACEHCSLGATSDDAVFSCGVGNDKIVVAQFSSANGKDRAPRIVACVADLLILLIGS